MTVVVPTLNRGSYVLDCVRDLLAQRHRPLEILIVDQSPQPAPALLGLAQAHPDVVRYERVRFRGLPEARNFGWQRARYEAIVFVDDDIRCGPDLVSEHLRALRRPGVGVVGGGIDEARGERDSSSRAGVFRRWTASPLAGFSSFRESETDHARGSNFSAWRAALVAAGGFDERMNVGAALYEEAEFCFRARKAGFRVWFNGNARVTHLAAGDGGCRVRDVAAYVYGLAHNRAILIRRHVPRIYWPTALARLGLLGLAFATRYRRVNAIVACMRGLLRGWQVARMPVRCSSV